MNREQWNRAVDYHGHECPGLAMGVKACEAAVEKMGVRPAFDEELVCITENDACGVDAIQALMGCTFGKGNLLYKPTGKHAYTFVNRSTGRAMRFYLIAQKGDKSREQFMQYLLDAPADEVFRCKAVELPPPAPARRFSDVQCELCGEAAPEHKIRLQEGKKVCLDCFVPYDRGF